MAWYDVFSGFYDASLEPLYRVHRERAVAALQLTDGSFVLDLPCGTGQSFMGLTQGLGRNGRVVGVDLTSGMLRQARKRVTRDSMPQVTLLEGDAATLSHGDLGGTPDRLLVFLGMSVFPN